MPSGSPVTGARSETLATRDKCPIKNEICQTNN